MINFNISEFKKTDINLIMVLYIFTDLKNI